MRIDTSTAARRTKALNLDIHPLRPRPPRPRIARPLFAGRQTRMDDEDDQDDKGTPARDHHDSGAFEGSDEAVSDQQGETAPAGADEPKDGEEED